MNDLVVSLPLLWSFPILSFLILFGFKFGVTVTSRSSDSHIPKFIICELPKFGKNVLLERKEIIVTFLEFHP